MRFRVGDTVRISKTSSIYKETKYKDREGKVYRVSDSVVFPIGVNWDGYLGINNIYDEHELRLFKRGEINEWPANLYKA